MSDVTRTRPGGGGSPSSPAPSASSTQSASSAPSSGVTRTKPGSGGSSGDVIVAPQQLPQRSLDFDPRQYSFREATDSKPLAGKTGIDALYGGMQLAYAGYTSKMLPPKYDQVPMIVDAIKAIQNDNIGGAIEGFLKSAMDVATTPEFILALEGRALSEMENRPLHAMATYSATGGDVIRAAHAQVGNPAYEPVDAAEQPNVSALYDISQGNLSVETKDLTMGLVMSLPADQRRKLPEDMNKFVDHLESALTRQYARGEQGAGAEVPTIDRGVEGNVFSNYREEVAADAYVYLQDNPIETPEDETNYVVWFWKAVEQKKAEIRARDTVSGTLTAPLVIPYQAVTNLQTKALNNALANIPLLDQVRAPNENLSNVHMSPWKNIAYTAGKSPGDGPGWGSTTIGKQVLRTIQVAPAAALPITWPLSVYRLAEPALRDMAGAPVSQEMREVAILDRMVGTPGVSSFFEEMGMASDWEWISGGGDLLNNIYVDPINYMAGIGLGLRATKTTLRGINITRTMALKQALVPFYGPLKTGVRRPMTSRVVWAVLSKNGDEFIEAAVKKGKIRPLLNDIAGMSGPNEVMHRVDALAGKPRMSAAVWLEARAVVVGESTEELFIETLRANMSGGGKEVTTIGTESKLHTIINAGDDDYHRSVQGALDSGQVGIRDAMGPTTGAVHPHPFEVVGETSATRQAENLSGGFNEEYLFQGRATTGNALDVRGGGLTFSEGRALDYAGEGEVLVFRRSELPDNLRSMLDEGGEDLEQIIQRGTREEKMAALEQEAIKNFPDNPKRQAEYLNELEDELIEISGTIRASGAVPAAEFRAMAEAGRIDIPGVGPRILRVSATEGDGTRKIAINSKRGFETIEASDKNLIKWLTDNEHMDLAAKMQAAAEEGMTEADQLSIFGLRISDLSDEEIKIIKHYLDDVADADAFAHGDELLMSKSSDNKLLFGDDLETRVPLEQALPSESRAQAVNYAARQSAMGDGHHELMIISQMPRVKKASKLQRSSGKSRWSQFWRRGGFGVTVPEPVHVDFGNMVTGGADLERMMQIMGTSSTTRTKVMNAWINAGSMEERAGVFFAAMNEIGEDLGDMKALQYGLRDHARLQGERLFGIAPGGTDIGAARLVDGKTTVVPTLMAHMDTKIPLPKMSKLGLQRKRYIHAKTFQRLGMNRLARGFGLTKEKRTDLVEKYKRTLRKNDPKGYQQTIKNLGGDDGLLAIAYADVFGYHGRADGLGKINAVTSFGGSLYGAYHSMFTVAQLAFRPLPWAGRVLLEEQVRGWMMGLPTMFSNPTMTASKLWDAHWGRIMVNKSRKQVAAAEAVAFSLFAGDPKALKAGIAEADKILPGFAKKAEKLDGGAAVRSKFVVELTNSLMGASKSTDIASRGSMARRTIHRKNRVAKATKRFEEQYKIDLTEWDFSRDVGEIYNKFNTITFGTEARSSIKRLSFSSDLREQDISAFSDSFAKKIQQLLSDRAGSYALRRMVDNATGVLTDNTAEAFTRTAYWANVRKNMRDVARGRGKNVDNVDGAGYLDDVALAEFYLDEIVAKDWIIGHLRGLWGNDTAEKVRILDEFANGKRAMVSVGGVDHTIDARMSHYEDSRKAYTDLFHDLYSEGNFNFPDVAGYYNPMVGNVVDKNITQHARKATNWVLENFGENASMAMHRQPSYLYERQLWIKQLERLGWTPDEASHFAHQKAVEIVNYTFFNNQHTGYIISRMNKAIPFFGAWAEVMSTWAYKIPMQNIFPLGYIDMMRRMDNIMQGFVKMGIVDISDDGQWYVNLDHDSDAFTAAGRGASKGLMEWIQAPVNVIEQMANISRWAGSEATGEVYESVDFSAWKKDDYQLAIGSPTDPTSHGIMGVNQFNFGLGPVMNLGATQFLARLPFAVDTGVVEGNTLAEMYENLPDTVGVGPFLQGNEVALTEHLGPDVYNTLWKSGGYLAEPELIDTTGMQLTVPGTSLMDSWLGGVVENTIFPYGHVQTPMGLIREIVPSTISYMLRGAGAIYANEGQLVEGLLTAITGPLEEYQIAGEMAKQAIYLESTEGLITEMRRRHEELTKLARAAGFTSIEEARKQLTPGSEYSEEFTRKSQQLQAMNDSALKRMNDNAGMSLLARGLMGAAAPATPRMAFREEEIKSQWWGTRSLAEAAAIRGGGATMYDAVGDMSVRSIEDIERIMILTDKWLSDPSGGEAKAWFLETYPMLLAWTNPTSYWGPGLAPPEQRSFDAFFDDVEAGRKTVYTPEVMMQRIARTAIAAQYESQLIQRFGNDPHTQISDILNNWDDYMEITDNYHMKRGSLDIMDDDLFDSEYSNWRERNSDDKPLVYEQVLDQLYVMKKAKDELMAMADLADLSPDEIKTTNDSLNRIVNNFLREMREIADELDGDEEYRNLREEGIAKYFLEISGPLYEETQEEYAHLDEARNKEERSEIFESAKLVRNQHISRDHSIEVDGVEIPVPNEMQRSWTLNTDEEKTYKLSQWTTRPVEWLDLFSIEKLVESNPELDQYLPSTAAEAALFDEAARRKREIATYSRENPGLMSSYKRTQAMAAVEESLKSQLMFAGRHQEIWWMDAWPIERLMVSGQWPASLKEVGEYYLGIKDNLATVDGGVGPTSTAGRVLFNELERVLYEEWFPQNRAAEEEFRQLGLNVFGTNTPAETMARLYGSFIGELN